MSAKIVFSSALVVAILGLAPVRAQNREGPSNEGPVPLPPTTTGASPRRTEDAPMFVPPPGGLSDWITYNRLGGLGPMGNGVPFMTELFLRSGWSVPTAATTMGRTLSPGWEIEGGGRLLLFNNPLDRAWAFEASLSNAHNQGQHSDIIFPLHVLAPITVAGTTIIVPQKINVTVRDLNRTYVNLGMGREWYLFGSAAGPGRIWRMGMTAGGRWGTSKLEVHEFRHRTDTLGGVYWAAHSDVEVPLGGVTLLGGLRGEWDYTWSDILQRPSDIMGVNVLFTMGLRF